YVALGQTGAGNILSYSTTDTVAATGAGDTVTLGDGNNVVLAGMGADTVTTADGTDLILGDNGTVQMDAEGVERVSVTSTQLGISGTNLTTDGDDTIVAGDGTKTVVGGDGSDDVTLGLGGHVVAGDNAQITYVDAGAGQPVNDGKLLSVTTLDTVTSTGGGDTVTLGDGNNIVLGGMGADSVTTGTGTDTVLGDNGTVQMDAQGGNFAQISTFSQPTTGGSLVDLGGNDTVTGGTGTKTVLAGDGSDAVTLGTGDHTVVGDNGTVTYVALGQTGAGNILSYSTTDTVAATGAGDTVTLGDGNNVVLAGNGDDAIATGNGTDTIVGDGGTVTMDAAGLVFESAVSTQPDLGGNDSITSVDGTKTIVGGVGDDTIAVATGTHYIAGDNASLNYYATGVLAGFATTSPAVGGDDMITATGGNNVILAGAGNDGVTTGAGQDALLGDNGTASFDTLGLWANIESTDPLIGGSDVLSSGEGSGALIGGNGTDSLTGGTGQDMLMGDGGRATYSAGSIRLAETIDPFIGAVDQLDGGGGQNVLLGGDSEDLIYGNLTNDVLAGDYASVIFDAAGHVTSVIRYGAGTNDLIAQVQDSLFTYTRPASSSFVIGSVYVPPAGGITIGGSPATRLAEYVTLSTISGVEYTHSGESAQSTAPSADEAGSPDAEGSSDEAPATPDEAAPAPDSAAPSGASPVPGDEQGVPQNRPQATDSGDQPPVGNAAAQAQTDADDAPRPPSLDPAAGRASIAWGDSLAAADSSASAGKAEPFEMLMAGLVGMQAWYSRFQSKAEKSRSDAAEVSIASAVEEGRFGQWIRAASGTKGGETVMLDRRATPRPEPGRKLPAGAIEQTAEKWLDSAYGLHSSVQNTQYGDKIAGHAVIDWGDGIEPRSAAAEAKAAGSQKSD
ncbi:MAG: calcium-binding protein, partial [Sulfuritalea sp.]|nr:calcium-binding protein [Sulfuritalea sp.]